MVVIDRAEILLVVLVLDPEIGGGNLQRVLDCLLKILVGGEAAFRVDLGDLALVMDIYHLHRWRGSASVQRLWPGNRLSLGFWGSRSGSLTVLRCDTKRPSEESFIQTPKRNIYYNYFIIKTRGEVLHTPGIIEQSE